MDKKTIQNTLSLILVALITACGNNTDQNAQSDVQTENTIDRSSKKISRADYGKEWPFTVDEGILKCDGNGGVVFVANEISYGVNGLAKSKGYAEIEEIWAFDTVFVAEMIKAGASKSEAEEMKPRIGIGAILADGRKLCK